MLLQSYHNKKRDTTRHPTHINSYKGLRRGDTPASPNKGDGCPFRPLNPCTLIICLSLHYVKEKRLPLATNFSTLSGFIVYNVLAKYRLSEDTRTATLTY